MWISPNQATNDWNQRETGAFRSLWALLTRSWKFGKVSEKSFCKGGTTWSPLCYWAELPSVDISCKSSAKYRNQRETQVFRSLWPLFEKSGKFGKVAEKSFSKVGTTWLMWSTLCYWVEFPSVDISCKSSDKRSESKRKGSIWEPLEFDNKIEEWCKSCIKVVSKARDFIAHLVYCIHCKTRFYHINFHIFRLPRKMQIGRKKTLYFLVKFFNLKYSP